MIDLVWLVPFFPLLGFLINGLLGPRLSEKQVGIIGSATVGFSFLIAAFIFRDLLQYPAEARFFTKSIYSWISTGNFDVRISFLVDQLSTVMMLIVTGVGFLIHVYSIGYMAGDRGFARYFSFLNLFTFAMLLLVLADNFLLMFVGWEGVGLCSYLLIGYWFENSEYAYAGRKAFVVNRVGDFGFLLGIFLIFAHFGTLNFDSIFSQAAAGIGTGLATVISLLLFVGATGKSAQIPLYVWLPDAMAGPTPVSALIHAATMVTAGVYMVARCHVLYLNSPIAMDVVAVIGLATAFLAATIA
ncbi:MAG: NADH-quinone oxidoreductase subunit L, partial [Calditrichaeota bacterium]